MLERVLWMGLVLAVMYAVSASIALGAGGKNRLLNPVITGEACVVMVPDGLDDSRCVLLPADDSALAVYLCAMPVVCAEED